MVQFTQRFGWKAPMASLAYQFDLTGWLQPGDNMTTATLVSISPSGLKVTGPYIADPFVNVAFGGGVDQTQYMVQINVTSRMGKSDMFWGQISVMDPHGSVLELIGPEELGESLLAPPPVELGNVMWTQGGLVATRAGGAPGAGTIE